MFKDCKFCGELFVEHFLLRYITNSVRNHPVNQMTREIIAVTKNSLDFNIEAFAGKHFSSLGVGDGCRSSAIAILTFLKQVKRLPSGQSLVAGSIAKCPVRKRGTRFVFIRNVVW